MNRIKEALSKSTVKRVLQMNGHEAKKVEEKAVDKDTKLEEEHKDQLDLKATSKRKRSRKTELNTEIIGTQQEGQKGERRKYSKQAKKKQKIAPNSKNDRDS